MKLHSSIDLAPNGILFGLNQSEKYNLVFAPNQSENSKYNLISVRLNILRIDFCVCNELPNTLLENHNSDSR